MRLAMSRFSSSEDEKLINAIKQHPAMYDLKHPLYKNQLVRDNIWSEVSELVGKNIEDCKKRWKSVRDTFMKNRKKAKMVTGFVTSNKPLKWNLETQLLFLNDVESERSSLTNVLGITNASTEKDNIDRAEISISENSFASLPSNDDSQSGSDDIVLVEGPSNIKYNRSKARPTGRKRKLQDKLIDMMEQRAIDREAGRMELIIAAINKKNQNNEEEHAVDSFFKSMAKTVKRLPPEIIAEVKLKVCSIVTNAELSVLCDTVPSPAHSLSSTHSGLSLNQGFNATALQDQQSSYMHWQPDGVTDDITLMSKMMGLQSSENENITVVLSNIDEDANIKPELFTAAILQQESIEWCLAKQDAVSAAVLKKKPSAAAVVKLESIEDCYIKQEPICTDRPANFECSNLEAQDLELDSNKS